MADSSVNITRKRSVKWFENALLKPLSAVQFKLLDKKQQNYSKKISKKEIPYLKSLLDEISNDFRKNKPIKKSN